MRIRKSTMVAIVVIVGLVGLQAIRFFNNYYPGGKIRTESEAIALARAAHLCGPLPDGPWRAVLKDGTWIAHAEWTHGFPRVMHDGEAAVWIDARTGKIKECRIGAS